MCDHKKTETCNKTLEDCQTQPNPTDSLQSIEEEGIEDLPLSTNCPFCGASGDWFDPDKGECRYCGFF